jgi:hypothetical protein
MWDLWWTKYHSGRFSPSTSVLFANSHSTECYILSYHPGLVQYANYCPTYQVDSVSSSPKNYSMNLIRMKSLVVKPEGSTQQIPKLRTADAILNQLLTTSKHISPILILMLAYHLLLGLLSDRFSKRIIHRTSVWILSDTHSCYTRSYQLTLQQA